MQHVKARCMQSSGRGTHDRESIHEKDDGHTANVRQAGWFNSRHINAPDPDPAPKSRQHYLQCRSNLLQRTQ
jgi:hypothetical protein